METSVHSDDQLMKEFREGNEKAFLLVYKMFSKQLLYFASRLTNDVMTAEEIVSDVLSILFKKCGDFETLVNVKAFLYISVRNKCLNFLKSNARYKTAPIELTEDHHIIDEDAVAEIVRTELLHQIYQEIEGLPPVQRSVFKLFFVDGLTTGEICARLNLSDSAVWTNKSLAIKKLRENPIIKRMLSLVLLFIKLYSTLASRQSQATVS